MQKRKFNAAWIGILWIVAGICPTAAQEPASPVDITSPTKVLVGAAVEIRWQGELGEGDFISIDPGAAPQSEYGKYFYAKRSQPGMLRAPETPGS